MKDNDQEPIQSNSTSCTRHQTKKEHKHQKDGIKTAQAVESLEDSTVPTYDHQTLLNKRIRSRRQTESGRAIAIKIKHNRRTALTRSVINYWRGGGLNRLYNIQTVRTVQHPTVVYFQLCVKPNSTSIPNISTFSAKCSTSFITLELLWDRLLTPQIVKQLC